jgi:molybdopterin-binding protein
MNSIRNQIEGTITKVTSDKVMTEVILNTTAGEIVAVITTTSVRAMKLKRGKVVSAVFKATNVSLKDCECGGH